MLLAGIPVNSIHSLRELRHTMAVDGYNDSVEFALRNLQKEILELTVHQK